MITVLIQMSGLILCGILWRLFKPAGLTGNQTRLVLTQVVYFLFLPALVLSVLWQAKLGANSVKYSILGASSIIFGAVIIWGINRFIRMARRQLGAILLATAFPNVTYLGLPVLEKTFGSWARSVAIQIDLFAGLPLLLTVGILVARHYGDSGSAEKLPLLALFRVPALAVGLVAVALNLVGIAMPLWLDGWLNLLVPVVIPLMLFSLGLGLEWSAMRWRNLPSIMPVIAIKLFVMPLFALMVARSIGLEGDFLTASVLEMAMPSMVLGIVLCDRYGLDTSLYAMAVTTTTLLSLVTLPLWYDWLVVWQ
ncbi:MAG: AEC family transporter [Methylococcales bacterium]